MREATKRGAAIEIEEFERRLRNQEAQRASLGDPLRELARLMQEQERDDLSRRYGRIFNDHRQPDEEPGADWGFHPDAAQVPLNAAAPEQHFAPHSLAQEPGDRFPEEDLPPPLRGSFYEGPDQRDVARPHANWRGHSAAQTNFEAQPEQDFYPEDFQHTDQHAHGAHGSDLAFEHAQTFEHAQSDEYYSAEHGAYEDFPNEPYDEVRSEESDAGRRAFRVKPWHAVAVACLVGALGVGWGVARIKGVAGSREIATIAAPSGPTKVAPAADASQTAKQSATVLDRGEETPVRGVVPHQEAPVEPVVEPPREPAAQSYRRVKTVAINEDSGVSPAKAPAAVERAANDAPATSPAASTTTPQLAAPPATTAQTTQKQPPKKKVAALPAEPAKTAPAAPAKEEAASPEPAAEAPAAGSAYVQFGAAPNESEARALAKKVVEKYGSRLGGHRPTWKVAEVGDKTVYRVRVGGLTKEAAASLCKAVKNGGGDCYVAKN